MPTTGKMEGKLGPCIVCGDVGYSPSMGGPEICPKCDCGHFDAATVERQAKIIAELRQESATQSSELLRLREALEEAKATLLTVSKVIGSFKIVNGGVSGNTTELIAVSVTADRVALSIAALLPVRDGGKE